MMIYKAIATILIGSLWISVINAEENPVVTSISGRIEGTIIKSKKGRLIYSFLGMRYARPPVGDLRFQV